MQLATKLGLFVALCGSVSSLYLPPSDIVKARQSSGLQALLSDINAIQGSVNDTSAAVAPFTGGTLSGLTGLIKIDEGVVNLGDNIDATTQTAQSTPTLNTQDSTQLGVTFLMLQPQITALLTSLQQKKPEFDKAGFKILDVRSLIRDDLTIQQQKAASLGTALTNVLDPGLQPIASSIIQQINGNFSTAINTFAGRGGKITIPAGAVPTLSDLLADLGKVLGVKASSNVASAMVGAEADTDTPDPATIAPATGDQLAASSSSLAEQSAAAAVASTSDAELAGLADGDNDLRGIPFPVLAVLRKYNVI